jgi:hypothetical protein
VAFPEIRRMLERMSESGLHQVRYDRRGRATGLERPGLGNRHQNRAWQALTTIATMNASTPEGLQAKARIVPFVIDDGEGSMEDTDAAFYRSFAADVRAFLDPLVHANWSAANNARTEAAEEKRP